MSVGTFLSDAAAFFNGSYSFDVKNICSTQGVNIADQCRISFHPNNTVKSYGKATRGNIASNGDVAGLGVWIGLSSGIVLCLAGLLNVMAELTHRWGRDRLFKSGRVVRWFRDAPDSPRSPILRNFLVASADSMTVITLSFGINFGLQGKCTVLAYHYSVGINIILLSCASQVICILIVRDYWKSRPAAAIRTAVSCTIFAVLGRFLYYQLQRPKAPEYMIRFVRERTDSALLLPMSCFLDPTLDPFRGLTPTQVDNIGMFHEHWQKDSPEWLFYLILVICFILAHVAHFLRLIRNHLDNPTTKHNSCYGALATLFWIGTVITCSFIYFWCFFHIGILREWVNSTGWMSDNGELNLASFGQLLPVVTLGWIIVQWIEEHSNRHDKQREDAMIAAQYSTKYSV